MAGRSNSGNDYKTLTRKSGMPLWVDVLVRVGFVFALVGLAITVHWFDRDGLRDSYDGEISFLDIVYFTMISITTTGYGDIAPVTEKARMFDALVVTPIRIFVVLIFLGTAYNFVLQKTWNRWRMRILQGNLTDHIVVIGFGVSGSEAVKELIARGKNPRNIVVIDSGPESLEIAEKLGCLVLNADATRDQTLVSVKVRQANSVIVSAGRDDTSILIVLTVRHLAPKVPISVVVRASDNEVLARQAGADNVINPVNFAGFLLAGSCHGEHISEYMSDLATVKGRVMLRERAVTKDDVGQSLRMLGKGVGLRVYRGDKVHGFWEPEAASLQMGDKIVEIIPNVENL